MRNIQMEKPEPMQTRSMAGRFLRHGGPTINSLANVTGIIHFWPHSTHKKNYINVDMRLSRRFFYIHCWHVI